MLDAVAALARRRGLVVVISDFIGTGDWERPLLRLAHRNEVVALRVVDAADDALPEVGLIVVEDAETGEQLLVDSGDPLFRARFRDGVDERDAELAAGMRRAGVPLHRVDTDSDLVDGALEVVAETRRQARVSLADSAAARAVGLLVVARAWPSVPWLSRAGGGPRRLAAAGLAAAGAGATRRRLGAAGSPSAGVARARGRRGRPGGRRSRSAAAAGTVILAMDVSNSMAADRRGARPGWPPRSRRRSRSSTPSRTASTSASSRSTRARSTTPCPAPTTRPRVGRGPTCGTSGGTSLADAILGSLSAITGKTVAIGRTAALPDIGYWGSATIVLFSDGQDQAAPAAQRRTSRPPRSPRTPACTSTPSGSAPPPGTTVEVDGYQLHTALDADDPHLDRAGHRRHVPPRVGRRASSTASPPPSTCGSPSPTQHVPLAGAFIAVGPRCCSPPAPCSPSCGRDGWSDVVHLAVGAAGAPGHPAGVRLAWWLRRRRRARARSG